MILTVPRDKVYRAGLPTSMMGLEARIFFSIWVSSEEPPTVAKYRMAYLAETVLPAPDSPDTMMLWSLFSLPTTTKQFHYIVDSLIDWL